MAMKMKKLSAVRLAVQELGIDAPAAQVRKLVKEKYHTDLTDAVAQNYTSIAKRELRQGNGAPASKPRAKDRVPAAVAAAAPKAAPVASPETTGNGVAIEQVIDAVTSLKGLLGTVGKDNVLRLIASL